MERYSLTPRQSAFARFFALLFLLLAGITAVFAIVALVVPSHAFQCRASGCFGVTDNLALLPEDTRREVGASPEAAAVFAAHLERVPVRIGLAGVRLAGAAPLTFLLFAVGLALRSLSSRAPHALDNALPWLRRAAKTAFVMVLAVPLAQSLETMLLMPGTPNGAMWYFEGDLRALAMNLLLAGAACIVVWVLDAGLRAQRDAEGFV